MTDAEPPRYREFLNYIFRVYPSERALGSDWWLEENLTEFDVSHAELVELYHFLLVNCGRDLAQYTSDQIAVGLNILLNNTYGDFTFALTDLGIDETRRSNAIRAITHLYDDVFDWRCAPVLCHMNESNGGGIESVCFMFWDVIPMHYIPEEESQLRIGQAEAIIDVLSHALNSRNDCSMESALHGLGHFKDQNPERVEACIDQFLASRPDVRPELRDYARAARTGRIL